MDLFVIYRYFAQDIQLLDSACVATFFFFSFQSNPQILRQGNYEAFMDPLQICYLNRNSPKLIKCEAADLTSDETTILEGKFAVQLRFGKKTRHCAISLAELRKGSQNINFIAAVGSGGLIVNYDAANLPSTKVFNEFFGAIALVKINCAAVFKLLKLSHV